MELCHRILIQNFDTVVLSELPFPCKNPDRRFLKEFIQHVITGFNIQTPILSGPEAVELNPKLTATKIS